MHKHEAKSAARVEAERRLPPEHFHPGEAHVFQEVFEAGAEWQLDQDGPRIAELEEKRDHAIRELSAMVGHPIIRHVIDILSDEGERAP